MLYSLQNAGCRIMLVASVTLLSALMSANVTAKSNDRLSFAPGHEPTSSACDGEYRFPKWARYVNVDTDKYFDLSFQIINVTNSDIFAMQPRVSWSSMTLSYELKPGTPGGLVSRVTAVLEDRVAAEQGGRISSHPQTWNIYTVACSSDSENAPDEDGDGISDDDEGGGLLDTDGDGIADSQDNDSDNDGIADIDENGDSDNDGIRDSEEINGDDVSTDSDGDGLSDEFDIDDDNDGIIDTLEGAGLVDTDNDNLPDSLDLDSDNDGLSDLIESGSDLSVLAFSADGALSSATGENGLVDLLETSIDSGVPISSPYDINADGIADFQDRDYADTDRDGVNDDIDIDDDNDGIIDTFEGSGRLDTDNDNLPDTMDLDSNNNGLSDLIESGSDLSELAFTEAGSLTNATGQNGLADLLETIADSGVPISFPDDSDDDGTANFQEIVAGLMGNDASSDLLNDPSVSGASLMTGLRGGGCTLEGQAAVDPMLILTGLFAFLYLWRRRFLSFLGRRVLSS